MRKVFKIFFLWMWKEEEEGGGGKNFFFFLKGDGSDNKKTILCHADPFSS